jgi:predicted nucleic acid-binding protein
MAWLLDTNILSEGRKPRPEPRVTAFYNAQPLNQIYISVVNIAEIRFGIELQEDLSRRAELNNWLTLTLRPAFAGRILPITEDILLKWRLLMEDGRKIGHKRDRSDFDKEGCPCSTRGSSKSPAFHKATRDLAAARKDAGITIF